MHEPEEQGYVDSTNDTKQAAVFSTLGLPWRFPAVYITYDEEHPKSSGGIAHFSFASSEDNSFRELLAVYESGTADVEFDDWLDQKKLEYPELIAELERLQLHALVVFGRRFLENYRYLIRFLKEECPEIAHTKGSPVYDKAGRLVAFQNVQIRQLPRLSK